MEAVKLQSSSCLSPFELITDDILGRILHAATASFTDVYRLRTVCKQWQQMLDSFDWRNSSHDIEARHSCIVKSTFIICDDRNWRTLAYRGLIWRQSEFFCSEEQKWFLPSRKPLLSRHWSPVAADGGLVCYQNASDWRHLCLDNPLKKLGFLMLPPIPKVEEFIMPKIAEFLIQPPGPELEEMFKVEMKQSWKWVDTGYGETVRLIVNRNPDKLKVVLTMFPASGRREVLTYSFVLDSTVMRWTMFRRSPSQTLVDRSTPTFLMEDVIYFRALRKLGESTTSVTFVRFHTVSGVWDETTITGLPCFAHLPLSFFQRDGRVYLIGSEFLHDWFIRVWQLDCSVEQFLNSSTFVFAVHSTMPRWLMNPDTLFAVRRSRRWFYFSSSQRDHSICMVSNLIWITHDVTTRDWKRIQAFAKTSACEFERRSVNHRLCGFSWGPRISPLMITGVEL